MDDSRQYMSEGLEWKTNDGNITQACIVAWRKIAKWKTLLKAPCGAFLILNYIHVDYNIFDCHSEDESRVRIIQDWLNTNSVLFPSLTQSSNLWVTGEALLLLVFSLRGRATIISTMHYLIVIQRTSCESEESRIDKIQIRSLTLRLLKATSSGWQIKCNSQISISSVWQYQIHIMRWKGIIMK